MESKVCIYRALIACILLFSASCIQKQDALIVEYDGPPLIQFRCILVPESPAMVHSIKIPGNSKNRFTDTIWYELSTSSGTDIAYQAPNSKEEYLPFSNTRVMHGETYILKGCYLDDTFSQEVRIPSRIQLYANQLPNGPQDKNIKIEFWGTNQNLYSVSAIIPIDYIDEDPYGRNRNTWRPPDLGFALLDFTDFYRTKTLSSIFEPNATSQFNYNGFSIDHVIKPNSIQFRIGDSSSFLNYFKEVVGVPIKLNTDTNSMSSYWHYGKKILLCDSDIEWLIMNMPENYYAFNTNQFSNVPEFKLPVVSKNFRGYALGYYYETLNNLEIQDRSQKLASFLLFDKSGNRVSARSIDNCVYNIEISNIGIGDSKKIMQMFDSYLTAAQLEQILNRSKEFVFIRIFALNIQSLKRRMFYYQGPILNEKQFSMYDTIPRQFYFYEE